MSDPTFEESGRGVPGPGGEEAAAAGEFTGTDDTGLEFGGTDDAETSFGGDDLGGEDVDPAAGTGLGGTGRSGTGRSGTGRSGTDVESPGGAEDERPGADPTGGEPF